VLFRSLIKDANALERLERVDTLVVDKTGTLTEGKPRIVAVRTAAGQHEDEVLRLVASLERNSQHPLAQAIVAAAEERGLVLAQVRDFEAPVGKGVAGSIDARRVIAGNERFMHEEAIDVGELAAQVQALRRQGATALFAALGGVPAAAIAIADPIKQTTPQAVAALKARGIRVVMLTGDNPTSAQAVAARLGISEFAAEVRPEDKREIVQRLRQQGRVVAVAGDGVNDAPALAAADVGIAMASGSDVAIESAGVTLLRGDLNAIVAAQRLSAATMANIRQNLFFAFVYNAAGVPIAAGALYPLGVLLSPVVAAAAMALSSLSVIANALRLRKVPL